MKANFAESTDTESTDAELILKSRQGDESAYGQMVERYQSLACSVAYSRCGDLAMSEDLAQEAFMQAWCKLADLKDVTKFRSWLCTIVRNLAFRAHEQSVRSVSTKATTLESIKEPTSGAIDPAERVVSAEEEQLVWQALAAIPENYREPMILYYREEQSVAKVAEALEISSDAVKQRLSRGRKFLQDQLAATVESTLEKSKPSSRFTSAVILGLAGVKSKTATAGIVTSTAAKSVLGGTGLTGMLLLPLANLPILAWIFKTGLDESRSPREKQLMVRHLLFWLLAIIPFAALAFGTMDLKSRIQSPTLRGMFIPGLLILYYIPMLISFRRMGKRIEQLRIEEKTDTPLRSITNSKLGSQPLFIGSSLLVACWPALLSIMVGNWGIVVALLTSAAAIGLLGSLVKSESPTVTFRAYAITLSLIALIGVGAIYGQRVEWRKSFSVSPAANSPGEPARVVVPPYKGVPGPNHVPLRLERPYSQPEIAAMVGASRNATFWWTGLLQATVMTLTILTLLAWKRVYGKRQGGKE